MIECPFVIVFLKDDFYTVLFFVIILLKIYFF